jgi:hypothetical protein
MLTSDNISVNKIKSKLAGLPEIRPGSHQGVNAARMGDKEKERLLLEVFSNREINTSSEGRAAMKVF